MIELIGSNRRLAAMIVVVLALVAANVMLLMQWQSANSESETAETALNVAQVSLTNARVEYDVNTLRTEEAKLLVNPEFPTNLPVVGLTLFLADGALANQVSLDTVTPPAKVGTESIGGKSYPAYATQVGASSGQLTRLTSYLKYIEGGGFISIRVQDVVFKWVTAEGKASEWQAEFTVVVISQK
jgi:hypothetical protein